MCSNYDEDLTENHFFQIIKRDYNDMLYEVICGGCIICVPRSGSLSQFTITQDDIFGHIICPNEEMPENHFDTLNGKHVTIHNKIITIEFDKGCKLNVNVLFEETYYTQDFLKYKVLCIEHPLDPRGKETPSDNVSQLSTLRDCIDFLGVESWKTTLTEKINNLLKEYIICLEQMDNPSIQTIKDVTNEVFNDCLKFLSRERLIAQPQNIHHFRNFTLALESYIQHITFTTLFDTITKSTSPHDEMLNKMIRNASDLQLKDLQVGAEFFDLIPKAKSQLRQIECHSTVLGKLGCLRKMMAAIGKDPESGALLATDDILPIVIFLILKASIANWNAQLNYIRHFRFSSLEVVNGNEDEYLVTTLEAALVHIQMGLCTENVPYEGPLSKFFSAIETGSIESVEMILNSKEAAVVDTQLCHPLCSCDKCLLALESCRKNCLPSPFCRDGEGRSPLHVAAKFGQLEIIEMLVVLGSDVQARDNNGWSPLHYAAARDHQRAVLLLVESGADVNAKNNSLNTPLHVCSGNGHLACVNGLIFHKSLIQVSINAQNCDGDTPLHLAARWGFVSIVTVLLEHGADPRIINKRNLTPSKVTVNPDIKQILSQTEPDFVLLDVPKEEGVKVSPKVDKMLYAISCNDVNLACFYLGLNPTLTMKQCHPLCSCSKCSQNQTKNNVKINMCNAKGVTALHKAVSMGNLEFVNFLVSNGASLNAQLKDSLSTPLILACQQQRLNIAVALLSAGCAVDVQDSKGNTALHYACIQNNRRLVEHLLMYKPNLNLMNKCGRTPFHEAKAKMALGIVDMLTEA